MTTTRTSNRGGDTPIDTFPLRSKKKKSKQKQKEKKRGEATEGRRMETLIPHLINKQEVDYVIQRTIDKIVVIRFGDPREINCSHLDTIVCFLLSKPKKEEPKADSLSLSLLFILSVNLSVGENVPVALEDGLYLRCGTRTRLAIRPVL